VQIQIYKECLLHKENELRNYARVIEVTNNMFKLTCNENQKLRDVIKQKEEKIEDFAQQIVLYKIKDNEKQRKIDDYENEIKNLKNISQNNIQNSQNINDKI
jgi:septal ring factor EnvC (AmiA/AmiB activator)